MAMPVKWPSLSSDMALMLHHFRLAVSVILLLLPSTAWGMMTDVLSEPSIPQEKFPQPVPEAGPAIPVEAAKPVAGENKRERVVILHGIARTSASMYKVARIFRQAGYKEDNIGYRSTQENLAMIIEDVYNRIRGYSDRDDEVVHFVCYSLGCLVTRGIIHQHRPKHLGRVVMLGPPNQGSELADYLQNYSVANWLFGPNLPRLGTQNRAVLEKLIGSSADYELGIIAGNEALDPIGARILPDADDGRVPVEHTKLPGMKAHLVMEANHTTLITNEAVLQQALHFIQYGQFDYDALQ